MISSSQRSVSETHSETTLGNLVAATLSGVWRESLPTENFSKETLSLITPLLYASGSAALGWWRIRNSELADSAPGAKLHDAYRRSRLAALVHEREIKHVLSLVRAVDIEPVLVKGWAIARRYPDRALRPYGDIDLCVRPDRFEQAEAALKCLESIDGHYVDLHDGFAKLDGRKQAFRVQALACVFGGTKNPTEVGTLNRRSWDELFDRSQLVDLGEDKVRVLCAEDHLRVLCLHLLRSGAWRPLWLCDVALAVESRAPNFDWARCLGADPLLADWVACTIGLAHQLLGADVENTPVAERARHLPRWLVPAVLRQWGRCLGGSDLEMLLPKLVSNRGKPAEFFHEIRMRWDRPVLATFRLRGTFNNWPRWPYQLADLLLRGANLPEQLVSMLRPKRNRSAKGAKMENPGATPNDCTFIEDQAA